MSTGTSASDRVIESVDDLGIGDGIYSDATESAFWVTKITDTRVVLRNKDDSPYTWIRETFEASLDAHTWIRESSVSFEVEGPSCGRESDSEH